MIADYGEAHLALGMLYSQMGKKDLAFRHYKVLLRMNEDLADRVYQKISNYKK
jgi:hypothetical protein